MTKENVLKEKLTNDMKQAMRDKNKELLNTIRLVNSSIKNKEIELKRPLEDEEIVQLIQKEKDQTNDSLLGYEKAPGDYTSTIEELKRRVETLVKYLPEQLSEAEIETIVRAVITEVGATSKRDMGKIMPVLMPKVKGKANGKVVNDMVSKLLS